MNLSPVEQINNIQNARKQDSPDALRRAAEQFEAVLLMQLTSALNSTNSDDEEPLFGGDGGTDLAKKMFSEQLATSMAQAGGVGLADVILRQFGLTDTKSASARPDSLSEAVSAVRDIKRNIVNQASANKTGMPLVTQSGAEPHNPFTGAPGEAEIISTFEGDARAAGIDDSLANLILNDRIVNTTRSRIARNAPVTLLNDTGVFVPSKITPNVSADITYQSPVGGRISSGFGNRFHPIDKVAKFHGGLDLAVPTGTSVEAAADGVVSFAGWSGGYGNLVIMKHPDGRETRYGHLEKILVSEGTQIEAGQPIALSGSTGKSTGPHLHFEIRENGKVINPNDLLTKGLPRTAEK